MRRDTSREMSLLDTEEIPLYTSYFDAKLTFGIRQQKALTVKQLFTIERLYKNWDDWRVRLAVWLIGKTEL